MQGLQLLFPTPVWEANIGDDKINKLLKSAIYDIEKNDTSFKQEFYPCAYSSYINKIPLTKDIRFKDITLRVLGEAKKFLAAVNMKKNPHLSLSLQVHDLFCNINRKYSFHGPHRHEDSDLSAVYYVDTNAKSSPFVVHNPIEPLLMHTRDVLYEENSPMIQGTQTIQPQTGKVLIFPSWLMHEVRQQLVDQDRISIAFNLEIVVRKRAEDKESS
jgi:uncharacterized protein (TIGR02466 family)